MLASLTKELQSNLNRQQRIITILEVLGLYTARVGEVLGLYTARVGEVLGLYTAWVGEVLGLYTVGELEIKALSLTFLVLLNSKIYFLP